MRRRLVWRPRSHAGLSLSQRGESRGELEGKHKESGDELSESRPKVGYVQMYGWFRAGVAVVSQLTGRKARRERVVGW